MSAQQGSSTLRQKASKRTLTVNVPADKIDLLIDAVWANLEDWRDTTADELRFVAELMDAYESAEGKA